MIILYCKYDLWAVKGRSTLSAGCDRDVPPWLEAALTARERKCAPEPRREEMPARIYRVKVSAGKTAGEVINESGTAYHTPLMAPKP